MKSIPTSCIKYTSTEQQLKPLDLYQQLYNGCELDFDLTENGNNCGFKYEKNLTVRSYDPTKKYGKNKDKSEFSRCIGFSDSVERIEVN